MNHVLKPIFYGSFAAALILLSGCTPEPPRAQYTVEEYRADMALRDAAFAQCTIDPGTLKDNPDCVNAREAARLEDRKSLRELPPVGLPMNRKP